MKKLIPCCFLLLLFASCKKLTTYIGTDIYIGGTITDANNNKHPVYWINNQLHHLPEGDQGGCNSIFVDGNDVYAGGSVQTGKEQKPCVWKNGVLQVLSDSFGYVNNITVVNGDVYACGLHNQFYPAYWKNGIVHVVSEYSGEVNQVAVVGNDVYACGFFYGIGGMFNPRCPAFWKNDSMMNVGYYEGQVFSTKVYGNEVYACGYVLKSSSGALAFAIKNGVVTELSSKKSCAFDIIIDNNNVYVTGNEYDSLHAGVPYLQVWENNSPTIYPQKKIPFLPSASAIKNNILFTVGSDWESNKPVIWRNGMMSYLSTEKGVARSIFIP